MTPTNPKLRSAAEVAVKLGVKKVSVHAAIKRIKERALTSGGGNASSLSLGTYEKNRLMFSDDEIELIRSAMPGPGNYEGNSRPRTVPSSPLVKTKKTAPKRKGLKRARRNKPQ